ncbi:MAG TPA: hypothetical protein VNO30_05255 [Kofleriaceae bacterium]|nr:hypothetical protein [Kofleriaceae bacterium]
MTDLEAEVQKLFGAGTASKADVETVAYYRLTADLWVARGKR